MLLAFTISNAPNSKTEALRTLFEPVQPPSASIRSQSSLRERVLLMSLLAKPVWPSEVAMAVIILSNTAAQADSLHEAIGADSL